jgi:hypothetical protein
VNGNHKPEKSNDDVISFYGYRKTLRHFPQGIDKFFNNLEIFAIVTAKLSAITKNDLMPFNKLKVLYLDGNEIEVLEKDLFVHNPHLEAINFSNNRVKFIDLSVFKYLGKLKSLWLENNKCVSRKATNDRELALDVINEAREKCFVDNILINLQNFHEIQFAEMKNRIAVLEAENLDLKVQNAKLISENENFKACEVERAELRNFTRALMTKINHDG